MEAVAICINLFGNEDPRTAGSRLVLASVLGHQGRPDKAEVLHREVLEMWKKLLGNDHQHVATSSIHLAQALSDQNKLAESELLFREALLIYRKLFVDGHILIAESLAGLIANREKIRGH